MDINKILIPALKHFAPTTYPATCYIVAQMDNGNTMQFDTLTELHNKNFFIWGALRTAGYALEYIYIACLPRGINRAECKEDITWRINSEGDLQIIASVTHSKTGTPMNKIQRHTNTITIKQGMPNEENKACITYIQQTHGT